MPDDQPVGASGRGFNLPILLVGALAAGALFPHLSSSPDGSVPKPAAVLPAAAAAPSPVAGLDSDNERATTVLDVLADFFGVDIGEKNLRRLVQAAPAALVNARTEVERVEPATLLRAFFCLNIRGKPAHAMEVIWPLAGNKAAAPPECQPPAQTLTTSQPLDEFKKSNLASFVDTYFNDDVKRDDVSVTRLLSDKPAAAAPVDESKLRAKDFTHVDRGPLEWAVVEAAANRHRTQVQFLIATVPDPIDSYETWQFDPRVDGIRQGIEASGYLLDRFYLPDATAEQKGGKAAPAAPGTLHTHWPGVILFRWSNNVIPSPLPPPKPGDSVQLPLLVLFLVPETPVAGIHAEPFVRAVDFASAWMLRHPETPRPGGIRILGPSFSGSTASIVRALTDVDTLLSRRFPGAPVQKQQADVQALEADLADARPEVTIVSGSASNDRNRTDFEQTVPNLKVHFRATSHSNSVIERGWRRFLREAHITGPFAYLNEGSTAFGARATGDRPADRDITNRDITIKFPFNIAELRNDESRAGSVPQDPAASVLPAFRPLVLEDVTIPTDQIPLRAANVTSSSVELVLSQLLDAIRRADVRVVVLNATDIRDKLFLIKEIRQRAPDVLLVTTDTDLFQIHPDQRQWLKGVIVASTYPLHASIENFVYPFHASPRPNGDLVQFPSGNIQSMYNAAVALLNYDRDGQPQVYADGKPRFPPVENTPDWYSNSPGLPKLIAYSGLNCPQVTGEPGVWISVVGDGQIVPVSVYCGLEDGSKPYVFRPRLFPLENGTAPNAPRPPASSHQIPVSGAATIFMGLLLFAGGAACGFGLRLPLSSSSTSQSAFALALCGLLMPIAFLSVVLFMLTLQKAAAGDWTAVLMTGLWTVVSAGEAVIIVWIAFTRRTDGEGLLRRGALLLPGVGAGVYAAINLRSIAQLFLMRTLDIGTSMSPILPIVAFGFGPIIPAAVEWWRLRALNATSSPASSLCTDWRNCLEAVSSWAGLKKPGETDSSSGVLDVLAPNNDQSIFSLPPLLMTVPLVATILAAGVVFSVDLHPVLSIEGSLFGSGVVLIVLFLQFTVAVALVRLVYMAWGTTRLLSLLGRGGNPLPYREVPIQLSPLGLIPRPIGEQDLRWIDETIHSPVDSQNDQPSGPWFRTATWTSLGRAIGSVDAPQPAGFAQAWETTLRAQRIALSVVFVIRELFFRLSLNLYVIGGALALLTVLHALLYFDQSHCLLGLIWVDVLAAIVVVMTIIVVMDRDTVISHIRRTTPGQIDWNWDFALKVLLYVVLPLVTLFATQFPNIGSGLIRLLEPVQRLPGK